MNKSGFYISISMILIGILLWLLNIYPLGGGLILGGVLLLISSMYYTRKLETETIIDERIERIIWIDFYGILKVNLREMYEIPILVGIYSWFLLRFWFSRRV